MGLVGYSDSEGSDNEDVKPQATKIQGPTSSSDIHAKPKFEKVAVGNKIRVNLPSASATTATAPIDEDDLNTDRPTKRAKTSAFSGINSFLPAPKNPGAKPSGGSGSLANGRGAGLGRGISFKTGAAPAFSRALPEVSNNSYMEEANDGEYDEFGRAKETAATGTISAEQEKVQHEESSAKPVGKPMMFKPLSVGRKPTKKKSSTQPATIAAPVASPVDKVKVTLGQPTSAATISTATAPPPRPKQSLFSSYQDEPIVQPRDQQDYEPEFISTEDTPAPLTNSAEPPPTNPGPLHPPTTSPPQNDLHSLASTLNLTPSQRRQLFGRAGPSDAKLTNFNLAAEYSANNQLIQSESAAPVHNPVRSIAPGKHSLQQLLSQAANQRDALEESFATAKRNKAAAGSKYGW